MKHAEILSLLWTSVSPKSQLFVLRRLHAFSSQLRQLMSAPSSVGLLDRCEIDTTFQSLFSCLGH